MLTFISHEHMAHTHMLEPCAGKGSYVSRRAFTRPPVHTLWRLWRRRWRCRRRRSRSQRQAEIGKRADRHHVLPGIQERDLHGVARLHQWQLWAEAQSGLEYLLVSGDQQIVDRRAALGGGRDACDIPLHGDEL